MEDEQQPDVTSSVASPTTTRSRLIGRCVQEYRKALKQRRVDDR